MARSRSASVGLVGLLLSTCACQPKVPTEGPGSPEAIYRKFMLANLDGLEASMRPLIVDQPGVELLWQRPYPAEMAGPMAAQFTTMEILRVAETTRKVTLTSSAAPLPLDVVFDGTRWRVDPAPIIAFRTRATAAPR